MGSLIAKIDSIHKMHHFFLIVVGAPALMWLLSGVVGHFRIPGSSGQFAMLVAMFLGAAVLPLVLGLVTLIFARPSVAWCVVVCAALFTTYVSYRSESRAALAAPITSSALQDQLPVG